MNSVTNESTERRITDYLGQQKTAKAASQIVKNIGNCDKKTVNSILYRLKRQGVVTSKPQGSKPMWSLADRPPHNGPGNGVHGGYTPHYSSQWRASHRGSHEFQGRPFPARFHNPVPGYNGPHNPYHSQEMKGREWKGRETFRGRDTGRGVSSNGWRGAGRGRGRGGGREDMSNTGRGRGRGGGRWKERGRGQGRDNFNYQAPNQSAFHSAQRQQYVKTHIAPSNQGGKKTRDSQFWGQRSSGSAVPGPGSGTDDSPQGAACTFLPNGTALSVSDSEQAAVQETLMNRTSAYDSSIKEAGMVITACNSVSPVSIATNRTADINDISTNVMLKKCDTDTNNSMDLHGDDMEDEMDDDFDVPTITRFQDMMGTLTFNDPAFNPYKEVMEEEEEESGVTCSSSSLIVPRQNSPTKPTMKELPETLKKMEEQLDSSLTQCGNKVENSNNQCTLTGRNTMQAKEKSHSDRSFTSDSEMESRQESSLVPTGALPFPLCGPPMPPKQWIESNPALFTSNLGPSVIKNQASSANFSSRKEQRPGTDSDPSTALLPLMHLRGQGLGRGRGRGVLHFLGNKRPMPGLPGKGSVTVSGSHDVREVESKFFTISPSPISPSIHAVKSAAPVESSQPNDSSSSDSSSNQADSTFRGLDEFAWKPLLPSQDKPPCGIGQSSGLSSPPQSSTIGQTPQEPIQSSESFQLVPLDEEIPVRELNSFPCTSPSESVPVEGQPRQAEPMATEPPSTSLHPRLQKFAAEGLTILPSSMASVFNAASAGQMDPSSGTFHKPRTPMELIKEETGWHGKSVGPCGSSDNFLVLPVSEPSSLRQSRSSPSILGAGLSSLPASRTSERDLEGAAASLQITSESFAALNKNPISALMEHAQSRRTTAVIELVGHRGPSHRPVFVMAARVGHRQFPRITCHNKKDGKKEAADVALRTLIAEGQLTAATPCPSDNMAPENMTHFDKIAALTHQSFNALIAGIPENLAGRKVIAGLVMKRSPEDVGLVISLGTGNRCITGDKLSLEGNTVNDSHAEVITRRGFMRFLYQELLKYEEGKTHELFERSTSGKLRVKNGVTFHLYISTAPCGDGALFSPRDTQSNSGAVADVDRREHHPTFTSNVQGLLRTKMEGGEGTIPVESKDVTVQTWDGVVRGERLRTMSCTDKICRWNVLGLQGALLSHFLESVYLDSLTLGFLYDHGHLSRAVCCRLAREEPRLEQQLSPGFRLNHPWLGRVTACQPLRETQKTKSFSINWVLGDHAPEVLDGTTGHCYTAVERKLFSRLAKRSLYDSFRQVAQHLGRSDLCRAASYQQAKMAATGFQTSKAAMFYKFRQMGCGWVKKPVEEKMFS